MAREFVAQPRPDCSPRAPQTADTFERYHAEGLIPSFSVERGSLRGDVLQLSTVLVGGV